MSKEENSIIEQALLEAKQIDKTFEANAKEILSHTMGLEVEQLVKESILDSRKALNEDEDDDTDLANDLDMLSNDLDGETEMEEPEMGELETDEEDDLDLGSELDFELGDDMEMDTIDLTGVDDTELISVFKKMGPDDEIEVVQDEDGVSFTDLGTGAEYKIQFGGDQNVSDELDMEDDEEEIIDLSGDDTLDVEDNELEESEVVYEIEITEEEDENEMDDELEEGRRTLGMGRSHGRGGLPKPRSYKKMSESNRPTFGGKLLKENTVLKDNITNLETENKSLKENQEKMVDALKQFRQKLQEVAVVKSNIAHLVRLFTENTTTKEEKVDIVKRMDEAKTINESKLIYKTINKELQGSKKPVLESINEKVNKTQSTGSSQITESKVYTHPELEKMKKLWGFNYKY